ncbi:hypothetical protein AAG570_012270 [Ranatra chinensis]|uniref:Nucleolar protein 12 n=1 Tax=Ranatra chinensis TaxID=642074 RepID=A0ABD0Z4L9_9HEMI
MEPIVAPRRRKPINRNTKLNLIFDETARREYLTGFHKRKLQRRKKAEEEFKQRLKEERKRIKEQSKAQYKKLVKTFQPIPELEEQLAKEYQVKNSTVSILELDTDLLAERNFIIGRNRVAPEPTNDCEDSDNSEIPGMEIKTKKEIKKEIKKQATTSVKKSKVFIKKNKMEQIKQRKKALNRKKGIEKIKSKRKSKTHFEVSKKKHKGKPKIR